MQKENSPQTVSIKKDLTIPGFERTMKKTGNDL